MQDVKDLFKEQIGPVSYVNLFRDEENQSRGCGILEFEQADHAKKAVEKMHRHDFKGTIHIRHPHYFYIFLDSLPIICSKEYTQPPLLCMLLGCGRHM